MWTDLWRRGGALEVRPFGVFRESPPLHFYLLQAVAFAYMGWRFASRSYLVYGQIGDDAFDWPRRFILELWPVKPMELTTFQFIYRWLEHPGPGGVEIIQYAILSLCALGLVGVFPRFCAIVVFLLAAHVTGWVQSSNAELDGGTLALCAMLVLALSPRASFYRLGRRSSLSRRGTRYHWPIFCLFLLVGSFYTLAGLNKLIDVGPQFPFTLHLERMAAFEIEQSIFVANRFVAPAVAAAHQSYALSVVGGFGTLLGELGFISILFVPRFRLTLVALMATLHLLVFLMSGINFLGSTAILLLCVDWNALVRRGEITFGPRHAALAGRLRKLDWTRRLTFTAGDGGLRFTDESGEVYDGADALEQVWTRTPLMMPAALLLKVPGAVHLFRRALAGRMA